MFVKNCKTSFTNVIGIKACMISKVATITKQTNLNIAVPKATAKNTTKNQNPNSNITMLFHFKTKPN